MRTEEWQKLVQRLSARGVTFAKGLSEEEIDEIEQRDDICFPPDLRALLMTALPTWKHFPDWRNNPDAFRQSQRDLLEDIVFDVERGQWHESWGERPLHNGDAAARVECLLQDAPPLLPVRKHLFMPTQPCEAGNPVYSIHQMDMLVLCNDLVEYLYDEFLQEASPHRRTEAREVDFWHVLMQ